MKGIDIQALNKCGPPQARDMNTQAMNNGEVLQGSALSMAFSVVNPFLLKCALRLKIPDIIWKAGPDVPLSVHEIAAQLPSEAPDVDALSRILTYLSTMGILQAIKPTEGINAPVNMKYALTNLSKTYFISEDINSLSLVPLVLLQTHPVYVAAWDHIHERVLHGGDNFKNSIMINYDLPHVIATAPTRPGIQHITGNLFESVPSADAIFMKHFLHIWDDEECIKLLNNCYKAVPDKGKLIIAEAVLDLTEDSDLIGSAKVIDALMLNLSPGGRERTPKQWNELLKEAGFSLSKIVGRKGTLTKIIEAIKC